jgi:hypothetical protein
MIRPQAVHDHHRGDGTDRRDADQLRVHRGRLPPWKPETLDLYVDDLYAANARASQFTPIPLAAAWW